MLRISPPSGGSLVNFLTNYGEIECARFTSYLSASFNKLVAAMTALTAGLPVLRVLEAPCGQLEARPLCLVCMVEHWRQQVPAPIGGALWVGGDFYRFGQEKLES